jgi:hypothetical protein
MYSIDLETIEKLFFQQSKMLSIAAAKNGG